MPAIKVRSMANAVGSMSPYTQANQSQYDLQLVTAAGQSSGNSTPQCRQDGIEILFLVEPIEQDGLPASRLLRPSAPAASSPCPWVAR
jgi:hypothetical protein